MLLQPLIRNRTQSVTQRRPLLNGYPLTASIRQLDRTNRIPRVASSRSTRSMQPGDSTIAKDPGLGLLSTGHAGRRISPPHPGRSARRGQAARRDLNRDLWMNSLLQSIFALSLCRWVLRCSSRRKSADGRGAGNDAVEPSSRRASMMRAWRFLAC